MSWRERLALLANVSPVALSALRRGQLFRPACRLREPDPDILCAFDVRIPVSDGFSLTAQVFRSKAAAERGEAVPAVMCAHPYDNRLIPHLKNTPLNGPPQQYRLIPQEGQPAFSTLTSWEAPDPNFWVPSGYAVVNINLPGYGSSEGPPSVFSEHQGKAYYDAIEWVAEQPWCTGKVGLNGVSFLAISQYHVAACRAYGGPPPALAAISPWEGVADMMRDLFRPGGVNEIGFPLFWWFTEVEPVLHGTLDDFIASEGSTPLSWHERHPLMDAWADAKNPDLEKIDLPTLMCATFSDHGVHTPGGFKAFMRLGSKQKWLYTHRSLKWDVFYDPSVQALTRQFFDCFLKGERDNGFLARPPVRLEVRSSRDEIVEVRDESAWPLERTEYVRLYLAEPGQLRRDPPEVSATSSYDATSGRSVFRHVFDADTEITGHMALRLWVEAVGADDMALCVAVNKRDQHGDSVRFYGAVGSKRDMVTRGFQRVSLRALDEERSEAWLPHLRMDHEQPLQRGEVVAVDIELYPSATLFRAGEALELIVSGKEIIRSPPFKKDLSRNRGTHILHLGDARASYLLVPVIPRA